MTVSFVIVPITLRAKEALQSLASDSLCFNVHVYHSTLLAAPTPADIFRMHTAYASSFPKNLGTKSLVRAFLQGSCPALELP